MNDDKNLQNLSQDLQDAITHQLAKMMEASNKIREGANQLVDDTTQEALAWFDGLKQVAFNRAKMNFALQTIRMVEKEEAEHKAALGSATGMTRILIESRLEQCHADKVRAMESAGIPAEIADKAIGYTKDNRKKPGNRIEFANGTNHTN